MSRAKHSLGFTLIEVLVALTIFALISSVAYMGLGRMSREKAHLDQEMRFWRDLSQVLDRMDNDFLQVLPDSLSYTHHQEGATQKHHLLFRHFDSKQQALQVAYEFDDHTLNLILWNASKPNTYRLLDNIRACRFAFMDASGQWQPQWSASLNNRRPRGIRLQLEVDGQGTFERVFFLP